jgi:two-component system sensor histidine kinase AlgZ
MPASESFLPDLCSVQTAFVLVLTSLVLALVLTLADFSPELGFWPDLGLRAFFIVWIALPSAVLLCGLRGRLARLGPAREGLAAFALVQCVALAVVAASRSGFLVYQNEFPWSREAWVFGLRILAASSLVTAAWLRYQYMQSRWRLQSRAELSARLDALQARMQPHFLFNSLNAIAGLVRVDPATAEELVLDMADVLRAVLRKNAPLVPLSEEIDLVRRYLRIEQQRLRERLVVDWDVAEAQGHALIPPLSLQPLVENAIRHGIEKLAEGGRVGISARRRRKGLVLTVTNTLPEAEANRPLPGNREAVANLRARLEACFEDRAQLFVSHADGCYQARIVMPFRTQAHENPDRRR